MLSYVLSYCFAQEQQKVNVIGIPKSKQTMS